MLSAIGVWLPVVWVCVLMPAMALILLCVSYLGFAAHQLWLPWVVAVVVQVPLALLFGLTWHYWEASRERQRFHSAVGYYLPQNVMQQLADSNSAEPIADQMVYGTCLFTDADRYTTLAESMPPDALQAFMNRYYAALFAPIKRYGGVVSDVKGDSMLSVWAAKNPDVSLRSRPCEAALSIQQAVYGFEGPQASASLPTRIGLHSGYMALGSIGAIDHFEYRPVGDIVNTASRLEGLNKYLNTRILVSDTVVAELNQFMIRPLGTFRLYSKQRPVGVCELIGHAATATDRDGRLVDSFVAALDFFRRQAFQEAIEGFEKSMAIKKNDGPSRFYLDLSIRYRDNPPHHFENGLITLSNK
jgi:adenylate cyclase